MPPHNDKYILDIKRQGAFGEGIADIDGYTVFVDNAVCKDRVEVVITKRNKNYGFAKILKIISPSPYRCTPPCPVFNECGGCQLMHINYDAQAEFKRSYIRDTLLHVGGIDCNVDFVAAKSPLRYRNKMIFPFSKNGDWGFYKKGSHDVICLQDCLLGDSLNSKILNFVKDFCKKENIPPYNEETKRGIIRRVFTRTSSCTGEIMVVISVNADSIRHRERLVFGLRHLSPRIASVILNINKNHNNLVLGDKNILLFGKSTLYDTILSLKYEISPNSFFQVNHDQTELLYSKALELAELDNTKTVFDIYCGIGSISLCAAKLAKKVIGIEIVPDAIRNAKHNAELNNVDNAEFYCGAAEDITPKLIDSGIKPDTVILDPPRKGSDKKTLTVIVNAAPDRIVYISCNPSTLARDLAFLSANGYKVNSVTGFDLFAQTAHVETVVLMSRICSGYENL